MPKTDSQSVCTCQRKKRMSWLSRLTTRKKFSCSTTSPTKPLINSNCSICWDRNASIPPSMYLQLTQGYNCCIFAYGQTGAGKTYSVLGSVADLAQDAYTPSRGILPRVLEQLFTSNCILPQDQPNNQQAHTITCSYLEIYN